MTSYIFINRFFHPDHSATSQILSDLAFHLASKSEPVAVIASQMRYDAPDIILPAREIIGGVEIFRVRTTRFGRRLLLGRVFDYLSFYLAAAYMLCRLARHGDLVVAKTDPPMLSVLVAPFARLCGFRTVNWLQDLYPEVACELGVAAMRGRVGKVIAWLRDVSLRSATLNVAIGEDMARRLCGRGIPEWKIAVAPNWSDDRVIQPVAISDNSLRTKWGLNDKFVVAYSGNLGRAHDTDTLIGAARELKDRNDIVFLFIGGGHGAEQLRAHAHEARLKSILFKPYQPREALAESLGVGDVHWLSLKPGLDGLLLPSKFYGIAAAGRPVIVIGSTEGELARLVVVERCGIAIAPGQSKELAAAIVGLADDRERCNALGRRIRDLLNQRFSKAIALKRWRILLDQVAAGTGPEIAGSASTADMGTDASL